MQNQNCTCIIPKKEILICRNSACNKHVAVEISSINKMRDCPEHSDIAPQICGASEPFLCDDCRNNGFYYECDGPRLGFGQNFILKNKNLVSFIIKS